MNVVHLGYEVGTGRPVSIPVLNLAVTGQTQESGKTTTLEALVVRSQLTALTFITKRGEGAFQGHGHLVQPYFRDRADWQFVTSIIDATLQEKNKFLRPWIIKICRATRTLADVQARVQEALLTARGIHEGVYTQLDAYLDLIVPEIQRARLADKLDLQAGKLNVMNVSSYATPMQMLFVQSALDWINVKETGCIVVIPEAWEFIPEGKGSPVKASAIALVRKGSALGNHIWVDSQDMAGVDKTILRGCPVWCIGVQREANEIGRTLANIPAGIGHPSAADVARLRRGQFYACWGSHVVKTYVQPVWMAPALAQDVARAHADADLPRSRERDQGVWKPLPLGDVAERHLTPIPTSDGTPTYTVMEEPMCKRCGPLELELKQARQRVDQLEERSGMAQDFYLAVANFVGKHLAPMVSGATATATTVDEEALVRRILARLPATGGPIQITPPEKLRRDFQREESERLVARVEKLSALSQRVLKLVETLDEAEWISAATVATRLGRSAGGGSWKDLKEAIDDLNRHGMIEVVERQGIRRKLREKIRQDLALYRTTDADIEAVYQNVLFVIAGGTA